MTEATPLPDDMTLGEAAEVMAGSDAQLAIGTHMKTKVAIVEFVGVDRDKKEYLLPPDMCLGEFRELAQAGCAFIRISDGRGGHPATEPVRPKELV